MHSGVRFMLSLQHTNKVRIVELQYSAPSAARVQLPCMLRAPKHRQ
jgi:hypothetical protein